jgi:hypothetical protein
VAMACWLRHYHLGAEAWWMGEIIGPETRAGARIPGRGSSGGAWRMGE